MSWSYAMSCRRLALEWKYVSVCVGIGHVTASYSNPKGNADTERVFRTFKEDVVWPNEFDSYDQAKTAVDNWVHFYNTEYPHSSLGEISPIEFENKIQTMAA